MTHEEHEIIIKKRGGLCEICHIRPATQLHHCIVRRRKGHPEYDVEENLEAVCEVCHAKPGTDSYEHSCEFWARQVKRGYDMQAWYDGLNLKVKERYD